MNDETIQSKLLIALEEEHQKRLDLGWYPETQEERDEDTRIAQEFREGRLAAGCDVCQVIALARGQEVRA